MGWAVAVFLLFCGKMSFKGLGAGSELLCQENFFRCLNLKCIPVRLTCDNHDDCGDKSDEANCDVKEVTCLPNKFKCADGLTCIDNHWICDNQTDCNDGSDEKNCSTSNITNLACSNKEFTCKNRRCIPSEWLCDKNNDCGDNSDELNCQNITFHIPECATNFWKCHSGECIRSKWKCDFKDDCTDRSDEIDCEPILCDQNNFKCKSGHQCFLPNQRCDGLKDCTDGSDEDNCDAKPENCTANHFKCSDGKTCLDWKNVCDSISNCPNGDDESESCFINECNDHNGHCSQNCTDLIIGYACSCKSGYTLSADGRTCEDVNECKMHGSCHQICNNTNGSYQCFCINGFMMEPNKKSCRVIGDEGWIYFANRRDIRRISSSGREYNIAVTGLEGAVSIDFDVKNSFVYWTDVVQETINRAKVGSNYQKEILIKNVHTPDGLAVDWLTGKLYWTDTGYKTIEVADINGANNADLLEIGLMEPRAISLDPIEGYVYWSDWGVSAAIEKISMDGNIETRKELVKDGIIWPNGITVDLVQHKLYWIDAKLKRLEVVDLDGKNRKLLRIIDSIHPFSLDGFEGQLYFTDWSKDSINSVSKFDFSLPLETLKSGLFAPMDVKVFHPTRQPLGVNPCAFNNTCSHLCLLGNNGKKRITSCKCPRGMHLIGGKCEGTAVFRSSNYGVELISTTSAQTVTKKSKSFESVSNSDKVNDGDVLITYPWSAKRPTLITNFSKYQTVTKKSKSFESVSKSDKVENGNVLITYPWSAKRPTLITNFSKYQATQISDGSYLAIFLSVLVGVVIVLIFVLIRRRRNQNKGQVLYYKDMSTKPLEEDFYIENDEIDEKANIIYQDA